MLRCGMKKFLSIDIFYEILMDMGDEISEICFGENEILDCLVGDDDGLVFILEFD